MKLIYIILVIFTLLLTACSNKQTQEQAKNQEIKANQLT